MLGQKTHEETLIQVRKSSKSVSRCSTRSMLVIPGGSSATGSVRGTWIATFVEYGLCMLNRNALRPQTRGYIEILQRFSQVIVSPQATVQSREMMHPVKELCADMIETISRQNPTAQIRWKEKRWPLCLRAQPPRLARCQWCG